jgi:hypothetical protein
MMNRLRFGRALEIFSFVCGGEKAIAGFLQPLRALAL